MNPKSNRQNYTNENTEDEILDSFQDEEEENNCYIKGKELVHLENDKSITVDCDFEDDHSMTNKNFKEPSSRAPIISPANTQKKRAPNELMKFISDSTEFYRGNTNTFQPKQFSSDINNISGIMQPITAKINDNTHRYLNDDNYFTVDNFEVNIPATKMINSTASFGSVPSFGVNSQQFDNKRYKELEKDYNNALNLVQYWQQFYLDIVEVVGIKLNKEDYFSEQFRFAVIDNVKYLIRAAKNKVNRLFEITQEKNFIIWGERRADDISFLVEENVVDWVIQGEKKCKSIQEHSIEKNASLEIEGKRIMPIVRKKMYEKNESIDSLPPMKYIQKKSEGMNTDPIEEEKANAAGINEEVQASIYQFEDSKLQFETMSTSIIISKANNNKKKITPKTPKKKDTILSRTSNVASYQFIPKKKLRIHKACECQTDLTEKNIEALELLSKECSHQLSITQKDKENMQQLYEDTIDALTAQIEDNKNTIASLREEKISLNQSTSVDPLSLLLPEMIPPEQTYKIFMHCVKHFKYEEDIYKKFMEEADLKNLKHFVTKMEKYIIGTSMPFKKTDNKKAQIASVPNKSNQRKANNNVLTGIRPYNRVSSHIPYNSFGSIPSEKRNNSTFSKYKAAISSYKKSVKY